MASIEKLYSNYELLEKSAEVSSKTEAAFKEILSAVKGETKLKQLACQFIVKFYKRFPNLENEAMEAQLDLCEDEDQAIRRYAIKELPNFCRDNPENVSKIADILAQLLATDDNVELVVVQGSLYQLMKNNAKECLVGVFQQISNPSDSDDSSLKEKTCKFVASKLATFTEKELDSETEKFIVETVKKLMATADGPTFAGLLGILSSLKSMQLLTVRKQMVEVIESKAGVDKSASDFDAIAAISTFYLCTQQAVPFFSKNVSSHKFATCLVEKVMPAVMKKLLVADADKPVAGLPSKESLLKLLAELSMTTTGEQVTLVTIQHLFQVLVDLMPTPPAALEGGKDAFSDFPTANLALVECAMYAFHALSVSHKDFFSAPEAQDRMNDFRKRLQYLALGVQAYSKQINEALKAKDADSDELKKKKEESTVCSNLTALIKDLIRTPPHSTAQVTLSWKKPAQVAAPAKENALKRPQITGPEKSVSNGVSPNKMPKQLYRDNRGRGGFRGGRGGNRGGFRGRGY